jgi:hypothetical protein
MEQTLLGGRLGLEPLEPIQPSRTIQMRPYRFDEERYGGTWAEEDTHEHAWASTKIACSVLELTTDNPQSRRLFALHAAAVASRVLDASDSKILEYFGRCSELEPDSFETRGDQGWEERGFLQYRTQGAALDDLRALIEGRNPPAPEFWLLLLEAWREELERRRAFLFEALGGHGLNAHPNYLILDAMHLFLNRLGMGLTIECYLYYLIAGALRDRMSARCKPEAFS